MPLGGHSKSMSTVLLSMGAALPVMDVFQCGQLATDHKSERGRAWLPAWGCAVTLARMDGISQKLSPLSPIWEGCHARGSVLVSEGPWPLGL